MYNILREKDNKEVNDMLNSLNEKWNKMYLYSKQLEEENQRLRDEKYKDEELQRLETRIKDLERKLMLGFPISDDEWEKLQEWQHVHNEKHFPSTNGKKAMTKIAMVGVPYVYTFHPTHLGTVGTCKCGICSEEFEFQSI